VSVLGYLRLGIAAAVIGVIGFLWWRVDSLGGQRDRLLAERDEARASAAEWASSYASLEEQRAEADRALAEIQIVTVARRETLRTIEESIREAEISATTVLPGSALHALGRLREQQLAEAARWAAAYPGLFPATAAVPGATRLGTVGDLSQAYLRLHEFAATCVDQIGTIRGLEMTVNSAGTSR
jgi:hypothetical protein